jgi:UDP-N-acetylglucosamine:LPS N-acetylglucosamine transferase
MSTQFDAVRVRLGASRCLRGACLVLAVVPSAAARLVIRELGAVVLADQIVAWKIDRLLGDPARLTAMRANAKRLARPHAARDIAATLVAGTA